MGNVSMIDGHIDEPRMTDNEIIKALECCSKDDFIACRDTDCPFVTLCKKDTHALEKSCLDLINRQKAEIEEYKYALEEIKAEAIKEFAERLQKLIPNFNGETTMECVERAVDNLVKEMVGDAE